MRASDARIIAKNYHAKDDFDKKLANAALEHYFHKILINAKSGLYVITYDALLMLKDSCTTSDQLAEFHKLNDKQIKAYDEYFRAELKKLGYLHNEIGKCIHWED